MADKHHKIIEGAAAVALGCFIKNAERFEGQESSHRYLWSKYHNQDADGDSWRKGVSGGLLRW